MSGRTAESIVATCPWGKVQEVHQVAEGVLSVKAHDGSGLMVDEEVLASIPDQLRPAGGWCEDMNEAELVRLVLGHRIGLGPVQQLATATYIAERYPLRWAAWSLAIDLHE